MMEGEGSADSADWGEIADGVIEGKRDGGGIGRFVDGMEGEGGDLGWLREELFDEMREGHKGEKGKKGEKGEEGEKGGEGGGRKEEGGGRGNRGEGESEEDDDYWGEDDEQESGSDDDDGDDDGDDDDADSYGDSYDKNGGRKVDTNLWRNAAAGRGGRVAEEMTVWEKAKAKLNDGEIWEKAKAKLNDRETVAKLIVGAVVVGVAVWGGRRRRRRGMFGP